MQQRELWEQQLTLEILHITEIKGVKHIVEVGHHKQLSFVCPLRSRQFFAQFLLHAFQLLQRTVNTRLYLLNGLHIFLAGVIYDGNTGTAELF